MKRICLILLSLPAILPLQAYNDHRGHNLDSLERVVAKWTPDAVDRASEQELLDLNRAYRDLMLGYSVLNGEKCIFYARKALSISQPRAWKEADADAYRYIGQHYYGQEQYDSALFYYQAALACVNQMEAGATSPLRPEGYTQLDVDDEKSALYGTIGNLYNMMGDIPQAMEWYDKAGEIFEQYGWNESNSVLHYNMGETWLDSGETKRARTEYDLAMEYAQASGDSLMIVEVWKGYGRLYMEQGKTWKSLPYLRKADAYYASHPDFAPNFRTENLDFIKVVLGRQKLQLGRLAGVLVALLLAALGFFFHRYKTRKEASGKAPVPVAGDAPDLTEREKEILDLLSKGYTATQIAEAIALSPETIRWYRKRLLEKFDVANTPELIYQAREKGVL